MEEETGGPAFPVFPETSAGHSAAFKGMTLRDYFAAKALQGWIANPTANSGLPETATPQDLAQVGAIWAYLAADAMLAERSK